MEEDETMGSIEAAGAGGGAAGNAKVGGVAGNAKAGRRRNVNALLAILYICAFVASFNENIVNVGLVDIMAEFNVTSATAQWLVTGYMVVSAVVVSIVAFLLNRFDLRKLFFFGSGMLALGSAVDVFAPTFPVLLVARLAQALGTGIFIPMMMNTVLAVAPRKKLGSYLAIGSCCITFGPAFGPVVGGVMVTFFGWRSVFAVPALAMVALIAAGAAFVYSVSDQKDVKLDVASVVMSAVGLTAFVVGLSNLTVNLAVALACIAVSAVVIAAFVRRQGRIDNPVLDMRPMRNPKFSTACVLVVVAMMTTFSLSVLLPLYFEGAAGTTALVAGVLLLVPILFNALTALIGGRIMDRRGEWPLLPFGFALIAAGMVAACLVAGSIDVVAVVVAASVVYAGVGFVMSPSQTAGLKRLPAELHPFGVALINTLIMVAASIGPSLFVGILSSTVDAQTASGVAAAQAQAEGFVAAAWVAMWIGVVGLVVSLAYTLVVLRRGEGGAASAARTAPGASEAGHASVGAPGTSARPGETPYPAADGSRFSLSAIMKRDAYVVEDSQPVYAAVELMLEHRTSGLPVVDSQGAVVGFISDGDIMKTLANRSDGATAMPLTYSMAVFANDVQFDERLDQLMRSNVMDVATHQVISVDADAPIEKVCAVLGERRIKKAPVLRDGKLVGTVSRADVTRSLMAGFLEKKPADAD